MQTPEIKPGWYRMRNGAIAEVKFRTHVRCTYPWIGHSAKCVMHWGDDGESSANVHSGLVEYLPDCTGFDYVPKPQYVPFTRETIPRDAWMVHKSDGNEYKVTGLSKREAKIGCTWYSWQGVLEQFTIDGKPAGRLA